MGGRKVEEGSEGQKNEGENKATLTRGEKYSYWEAILDVFQV